jgi:hypothetical protein
LARAEVASRPSACSLFDYTSPTPITIFLVASCCFSHSLPACQDIPFLNQQVLKVSIPQPVISPLASQEPSVSLISDLEIAPSQPISTQQTPGT